LGGHLDHRGQPAVLPAELRKFFCVSEPGWIGERPFDLVGTGERRR